MTDVKGKGTLLYLVSHSVLYHRVMCFFLLREALVWRLALQCPLAISFLITSQMRQMAGALGTHTDHMHNTVQVKWNL